VGEEVRRIKQRSAEVFMPLAHRAGEAQADFGEALVVYRVSTALRTWRASVKKCGARDE
jgi:hypothetical protein